MWLGYLELFGFLAIINMQEGKTDAWASHISYNMTFGDILVVVIFVGSVPFASKNDSNFAVKIELDSDPT